jgi:hypothetical protein
MKTGKCSWCKRKRRIEETGMIEVHTRTSVFGGVCGGSRKPPVEEEKSEGAGAR